MLRGGAGTTSLTVSNQASVTTSPTDANGYLDKLFSGTLTLESGGQFTESNLDMHDAATLNVESGATLTELAGTRTFGDVPSGLSEGMAR